MSFSLLSLIAIPVPAAGLGLPGYGVMDLITQAGAFAKFILVALLLLSILSWSITLNKYWQFRSFQRDYYRLLSLLRPNADLPTVYAKAVKNRPGAISRIFEEGQITLAAAFDRRNPAPARAGEPVSAPPKFAESLADRANHSIEGDLTLRLETATDIELSQLETGVSLLATITTVSPFIGLLGTVWGIMNSFIGISQSGNADLSVVAPGIAEALITTVAGLAVAIPAVLCHNFLANRLRKIEDNLIRLSTELKIYFISWWHREKPKSENRAGYQRDFAR